MRTCFAIICIACWSLSSCVSVAPRLAPTPTHTTAVTVIATPTLLPAVTSTASPTLTPMPSPTLIPTLTPVPTPEVIVAIEAPYTSPSGRWSAIVMEGFFDGDQRSAILKVVSDDGDIAWIAETITTTDIWDQFEWAIPFAWSQSEGYLYFTHHVRGDGCSPPMNGSDLYRLDLRNGEVVELVPRIGRWLALSPDESTLAYLSFERERGLVIRDLASGSERSTQLFIEEPDAAEGIVFTSHLLWSPDGQTLVLTADIDTCQHPDLLSTSIVRIDVDTLAQTTLVQEDKRWLTTVGWSDLGRVLVKDKNGQYWWMDPITGMVTASE
jgi:hypothetical protein